MTYINPETYFRRYRGKTVYPTFKHIKKRLYIVYEQYLKQYNNMQNVKLLSASAPKRIMIT